MEFLDFAQRNWVLFAIAFGLLGALIATELMARLSGIKSLSPTQATQLINHEDALLLDLRDGAEFRSGHIPGARNMPVADLGQKLKELIKHKNRPLILYCGSGTQASNKASKLLKKENFQSVNILNGGLTAWRGASLPLSKSKK